MLDVTISQEDKNSIIYTPTELTKAITRMRNPQIKNKQDYYISDITAGACTFMTYAAEHIRKEKGWG